LELLRNVRFVPSKLMSGVTGKIAALVLGLRHRPASRIEKTKAISAWGPGRKSMGRPGMPPRASFENANKETSSVSAIFLLAVFFAARRPVTLRAPNTQRRLMVLLGKDVGGCSTKPFPYQSRSPTVACCIQ
jgi:hypothetical protein